MTAREEVINAIGSRIWDRLKIGESVNEVAERALDALLMELKKGTTDESEPV